MTISEEQVRYVYAGPYSAGDIAPVPFTYLDTTTVKAYLDETMLVQNVDYSVSGHNVTFLRDIPAESTVVILRDSPLDNNAEFPQEAEFDSEKINDAIDKLTMIVQEQEDALGRALQIPISSGFAVVTPDLDISPSAGKALKWNSSGTAIINSTYDVDSVGALCVEQAAAATAAASDATQEAQEAARKASDAAAAVVQCQQLIAALQSYTGSQYIDITNYVVSLKVNDLIQGFTQAQWEALTPAQQAAIPLACIYE